MPDPKAAPFVADEPPRSITLEAAELVEDALRLHPRLAALLLERGVVCVRCGEPVWGTLGETIAKKGLAVEPLLRELERALKGA